MHIVALNCLGSEADDLLAKRNSSAVHEHARQSHIALSGVYGRNNVTAIQIAVLHKKRPSHLTRYEGLHVGPLDSQVELSNRLISSIPWPHGLSVFRRSNLSEIETAANVEEVTTLEGEERALMNRIWANQRRSSSKAQVLMILRPSIGGDGEIWGVVLRGGHQLLNTTVAGHRYVDTDVEDVVCCQRVWITVVNIDGVVSRGLFGYPLDSRRHVDVGVGMGWRDEKERLSVRGTPLHEVGAKVCASAFGIQLVVEVVSRRRGRDVELRVDSIFEPSLWHGRDRWWQCCVVESGC